MVLHSCCQHFSVCYDRLGIENGDIPDGRILASVVYDDPYRPAWYARLNGPRKWSVDGSEVEPWIQADIQNQTNVSGVLTQGDGDRGLYYGEWVTSFKVSTFAVDIESVQTFVEDENGNHLVSILFVK